MIYDFRKGSTAKIIKTRIKETSSYQFKPIKEVTHRKIVVRNNFYFYSEKGDDYIMFAYLSKYKTKKYNALPKFHICQCDVRNQFSNFCFSSIMPVDVYCIDQDELLKEQYLEQCKICRKEIRNKIFKGLSKNGNWYDYIIEYANNHVFTSKDQKRDGYVTMWRQISDATREKINWKCEKCGLDLGENHNRYFLEVHHKDHNKLNNTFKNLEGLCVLCHANEHSENFKKGSNKLKLIDFFDTLSYEIKRVNRDVYKRWCAFLE